MILRDFSVPIKLMITETFAAVDNLMEEKDRKFVLTVPVGMFSEGYHSLIVPL